jgi:serine/threonine protein kinase
VSPSGSRPKSRPAGDAHLTIQSDQFSLGLILYELATGKRPFQRSNAAETMTAIIRDDARPTRHNLQVGPCRRCAEDDNARRRFSRTTRMPAVRSGEKKTMGVVPLACGSCPSPVAARGDEHIDDGAVVEIATPRDLGVPEHRAVGGAQGHR